MEIEYPVHILPRACYRSRISSDALDMPRVYLQRKCYVEKDVCCENDDPNLVTTAAFGQSGLNHLSVNLLGGLFEIGDEQWYQDVGKEDEWFEGDVDITAFPGKYKLESIDVSIYFPLKEANNLSWKFPRSFETKDQRDRYTAAIVSGMSSRFSKKDTLELKCTAKCEHSPNKLNYWHFEVVGRIESDPKEEITDANKPQKRATRLMIEALRPFCTLIPPTDCITLPENIYIKSSEA